MSSSLVGSSNVSDNNSVDSNLHQHNVNMVDLGGDYDESDDYKRMGKKVITPLRSSLQPKMVQAVVCFDDCELRDFQRVDYVETETLLLRLGSSKESYQQRYSALFFSFEKIYFRPLFQPLHGSMADDHQKSFFRCATRRTDDPKISY
ncbi:hypothetical protein Gotri_007447 [Gossypium trilobum]|uniref:Uncharacterized protein n=1 Tax=Gossypium trilobum TaxID=34281 RepID=A0A7J9EG42_9ROSI|nr:hypothetical protein [Gossypium trilobum]